MSHQYDGIYFNQSRVSGEVRMSPDGLGWRATQKVTAGSSAKVSKPFLLPASELLNATWSRGAHDFLLQIQTKSGMTVCLDGFSAEQFTDLQRELSSTLDLNLEHREHSLRGWNWGKLEFERNEIVLNVASKPDFELPYNTVASSNLVGKAEVAVEMALASQTERVTAGDEVVEMRFFVPGTTSEQDADGVPISQAQQFHDQLQDRAQLGATAGSELVQFTQVLFTTPRGRYDIQFFADTFRLHGKTYDYKVPYTSLQRIFILPRLDELHNMVVLQLEPPLRQGQTRYPFLVLQVAKDEDLEVELNVDQEEYAANYADKLEKRYDASATDVMSALFKGLSGRKVTSEGTFRSLRNLPAVSCLTKAVESALYLLDRAILLISKSPMYIPYTEIDQVRFSRMATGHRTFDMTLRLRNVAPAATGRAASANEVALTGLAMEDHPALEQYLQSKNLTIRDDAEEARKARIAAIDAELGAEMSQDESEDDDFDASDASGSGDSDMSEDSEDSGAESFDEAGLDTGDSKIGGKSERKRRKN